MEFRHLSPFSKGDAAPFAARGRREDPLLISPYSLRKGEKGLLSFGQPGKANLQARQSFQPHWSPPGTPKPSRCSANSHSFAVGVDKLSYVSCVKPGIAIVGVASGPHSYFAGVKSSVEFMACSHVTTFPV